MTPDERLVEDVARAVSGLDAYRWSHLMDHEQEEHRKTARATLAVAEPAVREECAVVAEKASYIAAAAIRAGGHEHG